MDIYEKLIKLDKFLDYVPIASTVTNFVDLFLKLAFRKSKKEVSDQDLENIYVRHINEKSDIRCTILLIPGFGNLVVAVGDLTKQRKAEHLSRPDEASASKLNKRSKVDINYEGAQNPSEIFPDEIMLQIFNNLGFHDTVQASRVNSHWRNLASDKHLWRRLGREIGLSKKYLKKNPETRVKKEIKDIWEMAIAAGIKNPSLNTPAEILHVKLQNYRKIFERLKKVDPRTCEPEPFSTPPPCIQKLLNDPTTSATLENLNKLRLWLKARRAVLDYELIRKQAYGTRGYINTGKLKTDDWEEIFDLIRKAHMDHLHS